MFSKTDRLERQIKDLEKEIGLHQGKINKSNRSEDRAIHMLRKQGAEKELQRTRAALILAKAEKARKNKKIQDEIDFLEKKKNDVARWWVQAPNDSIKSKMDKELNALNKKISKLEKKKEK